MGVIGGVARPCIEGWVLALAGVKDTDEMSRPRCERELPQRAIQKGHDAVVAFVELVEGASLNALPSGCDSLTVWIERGALRPRRRGAWLGGEAPVSPQAERLILAY